MNLLVAYTTKEDELVLTGVYTDQFSLERKNDYKPQSRTMDLDAVKKFFTNSPITFVRFFETSVETDMEESDFLQIFHKKLQLTVKEYGDEKTITSLSIGRND